MICLGEEIDNFNLEECQLNSCPLECESIKYDLSLSTLDYPDRSFYETKMNNDEMYKEYYLSVYNLTMTYDLIRSTSAVFTIYYPNLQYTQISESPKTEIIDLFTQIGGALGMFVSFSIFTIFEFIELAVLLFKNILFKI